MTLEMHMLRPSVMACMNLMIKVSATGLLSLAVVYWIKKDGGILEKLFSYKEHDFLTQFSGRYSEDG